MVELALSLPGVESEEGQHVGFSVRGRRFAWLLDDHYGDGCLALNCRGPEGRNHELATAHPERFHIPSYLGARGWLGLYLDSAKGAWDEAEGLLVEAYLMTAPKRLAASTSRSRSRDSRG